MPPSLLDALRAGLESNGIDVWSWALAFARILPSVLIVPAFGLRGVVAPARIGLALAMALAVAPAARPVAPDVPFSVGLLAELAHGLPVALGAAAALWAAAMSGGLIDNLRSSREQVSIPVVDSPATPTGALLGMLVAIAFLQTGGPERIAAAVTEVPPDFTSPLLRAVIDLHAAIGVAVAAAVPLVVAAIVIEVAAALTVRAASPAYLQPVIAPLRSIALLGVAALVLDRMVELLVLFAARGTG